MICESGTSPAIGLRRSRSSSINSESVMLARSVRLTVFGSFLSIFVNTSTTCLSYFTPGQLDIPSELYQQSCTIMTKGQHLGEEDKDAQGRKEHHDQCAGG